MKYKKGEFTANTSTGNQSVTGLGFVPKALKLYVISQTADGEGHPGNFCAGMTDFTNSRCISTAVDDNVSTTNTGGKGTTDLLNILLNGTPTQDGIASIVSADSDGFTINWGTACSSGWKIVYEAWGGTDITVQVGTWNPTSGTGSKVKTGLGFAPTVLMWLCQDASQSNACAYGIGASTGSGQEYGISGSASDGATATPNARYFHAAFSILLQNISGSTLQKASTTSLDSDGWTYNFTTRANTTDVLYYMAINGGNWKVGIETTPITATTKQTSGLGFQPNGVHVFGIWQAATASLTAGNVQQGLGSADGISSNGYAIGNDWTNATTQRSSGAVEPNLIATPDALATGWTMKGDLSAWDADSFTINYSNVQGTAREFGYIAFGTATTPVSNTCGMPIVVGQGIAATAVEPIQVSQALAVTGPQPEESVQPVSKTATL